MATSETKLNRETFQSRTGNGFLRLLENLRLSVLSAVEDECALDEKDSAQEDEKDLFDRLPDPPHLDFGEVRYYDGKLRYFDE